MLTRRPAPAPALALLAVGLFACGGQLDDDFVPDQPAGYAGSGASAGGGGSASSQAGSSGATANGGSGTAKGGAGGAAGKGGSSASAGFGQAGASPVGQGGAAPVGQGGAPPTGQGGAPIGQGGAPPTGPGAGGGPGTVSGPACEACIEQVCSGQWASCQASPQCVEIADCVFAKCIGQQTGGKGCVSKCFAAAGIVLGQGPLPPSGQAFMTAYQCGRQNCPGACPSAGGQGGPGPGPGGG